MTSASPDVVTKRRENIPATTPWMSTSGEKIWHYASEFFTVESMFSCALIKNCLISWWVKWFAKIGRESLEISWQNFVLTSYPALWLKLLLRSTSLLLSPHSPLVASDCYMTLFRTQPFLLSQVHGSQLGKRPADSQRERESASSSTSDWRRCFGILNSRNYALDADRLE